MSTRNYEKIAWFKVQMLFLLISFFSRNTKPTDIYLFEANNGNNRRICEVSSKLTKNTPERRQMKLSLLTLIM